MDLSNRIRQIRDLKKIRQTDVAESLGMDNSQYAKLEKRGNKISLEQVERIANALGVSVRELLGFTHNEPTGKLTDKESLYKENDDLMKKLENLKNHNELLIDRINQYVGVVNLLKDPNYYSYIPIIFQQFMILKMDISEKNHFIKRYMEDRDLHYKDLSDRVSKQIMKLFKEMISTDETTRTMDELKFLIMQRCIYSEEFLSPEYDKSELLLLRKEFEKFIASNPFKE